MATVQAPASPAGSVGAAPHRGAAPKAAAETVGSNRELPSGQLPPSCNQEQAGLDALPVPLSPISKDGQRVCAVPPDRRPARLALLFSNTLLVKRHITGFCWMVGN